MFTRCPSCRAAFSITDQQLAIASGMVRCGVCEHVFDARLYLFQQAEEKSEQVDIPLDNDPEIAVDAEIDAIDEAEFIRTERTSLEADSTQTEASSTETEQFAEIEIPKIIADQVSSLEHEQTRLPLSSVLGIVCIAALLIVLALQVTAVFRADWLPASVHTVVCKWVTCVHKVPRALDKIEILNRSIYTHPREDDALMVTVTIISRATFPQPYPIVQLRFLDVAGDIIAARKFSPRDYLSETWTNQSNMQPARPVSIQLELIDFGEDVVGYEFDFL